jgi:hypothetical protein
MSFEPSTMDMTDLMACQFCGGRIDPQTDYQAIRGWTHMLRGDLHWAQLPAWACRSCISSFDEADSAADESGEQPSDAWCRIAGERP